MVDHGVSSASLLPEISWLLGWIYFLCWAFSSYPQPIVNFQRKSVTGLSLDYFTINILGHSCYTVSCLAFLYSETVREQYRRRWGSGVGDPTVRLNDLAFTAHALLWSCFTITQFYWWGYTRLPSQRLSRGMVCLILGSLASIALATGLVILFPSKDVGSGEPYAGGWEWLDVVNYILILSQYEDDLTHCPYLDISYGTHQALNISHQVLSSGSSQLRQQIYPRLVNP
ncbi:PQ loop repeat-domain-containing protein [Terfezia claveryi]|nr:PQ loop repeat-domain-containing protein [Terfezia claveryi]